MKLQKKLLSDQKRNDQESTQRQNSQKISKVETTKNHIEDKEDSNLILSEDWDNEWFPDPSN